MSNKLDFINFWVKKILIVSIRKLFYYYCYCGFWLKLLLVHLLETIFKNFTKKFLIKKLYVLVAIFLH